MLTSLMKRLNRYLIFFIFLNVGVLPAFSSLIYLENYKIKNNKTLLANSEIIDKKSNP